MPFKRVGCLGLVGAWFLVLLTSVFIAWLAEPIGYVGCEVSTERQYAIQPVTLVTKTLQGEFDWRVLLFPSAALVVTLLVAVFSYLLAQEMARNLAAELRLGKLTRTLEGISQKLDDLVALSYTMPDPGRAPASDTGPDTSPLP